MNASVDDSTAIVDARFEFGKNWSKYLATIDETTIECAVASLRKMLETDSLSGRSFLDIGCGSGLFSLAARRLGAVVTSFDYDAGSVETTNKLRARESLGDGDWRVERGSVLGDAYVRQLGTFDVVYSWGVLHHTGAMWKALANTTQMVRPGGTLFIAIYNDQGRYSRWWLRTKSLYNWLPRYLRFLVLVPCTVRLRGPMIIRDLLRGRPLQTWRSYGRDRGMSPWYDVVDWVGGLPFEVAKPEEVFDFCRARGFTLMKLKTCGAGKGCNEYVFST
jgi:2-polyprenyl-3-methyl-5-hydroxy-6-metoxy-1,4-benzoquinol methylase